MWEFNVVTNFNWKSDTDAGSKGKLSHRFQHKYTNASTYNISVEISNRVSSETKIIEAFVVWELIVNRIYVSHSETFDTNQSVFSSNKILYFRTDLMSGEPDLFHLQIDGYNQTSSTLPMFYTIKSVRDYVEV
ncbi:hypothetical protein Anas_05856 [Armadillidium nasatum]|uniref:PKD domain-containing protein n=1 Tax=Armadillidium nasatum TaxID=96803 RepID=A0A5N5T4D5_9CRUS|nr:hypothetical protein Anas_05856 [Armadillidium nasatum]